MIKRGEGSLKDIKKGEKVGKMLDSQGVEIDEGGKVSLITPELSKRVGWEKRKVSYPPNVEAVKLASHETLIIWLRFLPSAENDEQLNIMDLIMFRIRNEEPL